MNVCPIPASTKASVMTRSMGTRVLVHQVNASVIQIKMRLVEGFMNTKLYVGHNHDNWLISLGLG